ncbi:unnamed protein product, partial [Didymodactylos carnosus]
ATNSIWISVEYRLAPEHKYPIWLNDAYEVTKHIIENKQLYGAESTTKIGVAGDSAGGTIAASISHTLGTDIDFQVLVIVVVFEIYPMLDMAGQKSSHKEFTQPVHIITPEILQWFISNAIRDENDIKDPRISVLLHSSFTNVPSCLFIVAELDPLRDDSYDYQKQLEAAGIKTKLVLLKGVIHSFFSLPGVYPKACSEAVNAVRDFMIEI